MKKTLIMIISLIALVGLSACSNDNNKFVTKQPDESELNFTNEALEDHPDENSGELPENKTDEDIESEEIEEKNNEIPEEIINFEESSLIIEHIDLGEVTASIQTDNRNNRVIIFSDESKVKQYKSVFVKRKNRLKIINLKDDEQIFNDII